MLRLKFAVCGAAMLIESLLTGSAADAQAQNASALGPHARERDPKTLFEWTLGSSSEDKREDNSGEEDRVDPDRPHFPEASSTVGKRSQDGAVSKPMTTADAVAMADQGVKSMDVDRMKGALAERFLLG
jgi:hypothetical protein